MPELAHLQSYFATQDDILLAYLFGSRASSRAASESDYDIAVLPRTSLEPARRYRMAHELSVLLDGTPVDLIPLDRAPMELAYAVVAAGQRLFERELATRVEFEAHVLSRYGDMVPVLRQQRADLIQGVPYAATVRRYRTALDKTDECLQKLKPLCSKTLDEFLADSYLRDIVERNLEVAAQCCIDISNRIISLENALRPSDSYESLLQWAKLVCRQWILRATSRRWQDFGISWCMNTWRSIGMKFSIIFNN